MKTYKTVKLNDIYSVVLSKHLQPTHLINNLYNTVFEIKLTTQHSLLPSLDQEGNVTIEFDPDAKEIADNIIPLYDDFGNLREVDEKPVTTIFDDNGVPREQVFKTMRVYRPC